jgi:chaperonin GroES
MKEGGALSPFLLPASQRRIKLYQTEIDISAQDTIPAPTGFHLLIAVPSIEEKTEGGIIRPDELREREKTATIFGNVISLGPDCYTDADKFPSGPWCEQGDWVLFRSYSGTRFKIEGQEFRVINDDTVEAVVDDPRKVERA